MQRYCHPYTAALLNSIPKTSDPSHTRLEAIPGRPPRLIDPPDGCRFAGRCTYVTDKCRTEMPPLVAADDDPEHLFRCWHPLTITSKLAAVATSTNVSVGN